MLSNQKSGLSNLDFKIQVFNSQFLTKTDISFSRSNLKMAISRFTLKSPMARFSTALQSWLLCHPAISWKLSRHFEMRCREIVRRCNRNRVSKCPRLYPSNNKNKNMTSKAFFIYHNMRLLSAPSIKWLLSFIIHWFILYTSCIFNVIKGNDS